MTAFDEKGEAMINRSQQMDGNEYKYSDIDSKIPNVHMMLNADCCRL